MLTPAERAWLLRAARKRDQDAFAAEDLASQLEVESSIVSGPRKYGTSTREQEAFWQRVEAQQPTRSRLRVFRRSSR